MGAKKEGKRFSLINLVKEYIALKIDYVELLLVERVAFLIGKIALKVVYGAMCFLLFCFVMLLIYQLLMLCIGIAWVVSLIEIGILLILMGIVWMFREQLIIAPVTNSIVRILANSNPKNKKTEGLDDDEN